MIEVSDEVMKHAQFLKAYHSRYRSYSSTPAHWVIWYKGRKYEATEQQGTEGLRAKIASDPRNDPASPLRSNYAITEMRAINSTAWDRLQTLKGYQRRGMTEEPELNRMVAVMEQVVALTDPWKNPRKKRRAY